MPKIIYPQLPSNNSNTVIDSQKTAKFLANNFHYFNPRNHFQPENKKVPPDITLTNSQYKLIQKFNPTLFPLKQKMFGRRMFRQKGDHSSTCKQQACSLSTQESYSPENTPKNHFPTKEKSQLCRKYMQFGYCPYQRNCKFAHGSHQLKKNNNVNSKYKTKECGTYINQCHCRFGDRCNFIHGDRGNCQGGRIGDLGRVKCQYREIFYYAKGQSKLRKLFQ